MEFIVVDPGIQPKTRRDEIFEALDLIDRKSIRAIREGDTERIAEWEGKAQALRDELAAL